ncbi:MAG: hypothetical protein HY908_23760, partial [Myxococcales bacterium]|nr:hypothetical protein [Myxococcales bacterium]
MSRTEEGARQEPSAAAATRSLMMLLGSPGSDDDLLGFVNWLRPCTGLTVERARRVRAALEVLGARLRGADAPSLEQVEQASEALRAAPSAPATPAPAPRPRATTAAAASTAEEEGELNATSMIDVKQLLGGRGAVPFATKVPGAGGRAASGAAPSSPFGGARAAHEPAQSAAETARPSLPFQSARG